MKKDRPCAKKPEWIFFVNKNGYIRYNPICLMCIHKCKQSHKVAIIECPKYEHRR